MRSAPLGNAMAFALLVAAAATTGACIGTTGGGLVSFPAYASGPKDVDPTQSFRVSSGFDVRLNVATMHLGALYVNTAPPSTGSQSTSCVNPGQYVAQANGAVDVNLLTDTPQRFSVDGNGTADVARSAELWLSGRDINSVSDSPIIVTLAGTASRGGNAYPFRATVTIGANRLKPVSNTALPGLNPICRQRIVSGVPVNVRIFEGGALYLRIDPRGWFNNVDFSKLDPDPRDPSGWVIPDSDSSGTAGEAAGRGLFTGIRTGVLPSGASAYAITFE
ncbi:hypothetical protein [Pendulispora albinea]|uniref:Uncharacterized protein n=1 Tax=Pendulispora albinea TaxID=2741071 RepID=A0ABZ2M202_9BACT